MQGVGNDFVVLDAAALPPNADLTRLAVTLCDRHFGVGADGLLLVGQEAPGAAFFMRMFNPDGTEDMCGNGLRCAGLWAHREEWVTVDTPFDVTTKEGSRRMRLTSVSEDGTSGQLSAVMGKPKWGPSEIPFGDDRLEQVLDYPLSVAGETYPVTALNTGSTHTVIFSAVPPDEETFQRVSPLIETHPLFPARTSVLWATPDGPHRYQVRIWERGVGETLGCGTGASAVGAAALLQKQGSGITVVSRGGELIIQWSGRGNSLIMSGPAQIVFDGEFVVPLDFSQVNREAQF